MLATDNLSNKLMNRFFKRVHGVVWDLMSGNVGIQTPDGISTLEGEGEDAQIAVNIIEQFGMPIPAFAQSTVIDQVKKGDLIYVGDKPKGWVTEIKESAAAEDGTTNKKFVIMTPSGTSSTWTPPKVAMFGLDSGVMVIKSLIAMLPGGDEGLKGMQGSLMPLMMMGGMDGMGMGGDGDSGMDKIMPMLLMSQMGNLGGGAGAGNMIQMMMMMKMMGGKGGGFGGGGGFFE